jgi:3-hydroxymyristoyl/3-hydroxydecanoyl-(acyl carrier protein) dehydratase
LNESTPLTRTALAIRDAHPACDGHFPGAPVLPAVLLLDEALYAWEKASQTPPGSWGILAAKFLAPVRPGQTLILEHEPLAAGTVRFRFTYEDCTPALTVASGVLKRLADG